MNINLKEELRIFNKENALAGVKVKIEQRGQRLNLRGLLPSKTERGSLKLQRLSLNLAADLNGFIEAKKILELVVLQISHDQFDWKHWRKNSSQEKVQSLSDKPSLAIGKFKTAFFNNPNRKNTQAGARSTWNAAYQPYLRRLIMISKETNQEIEKDLLDRTLCSYEENSRSRQQCGTALNAFAKYLEIELPDNWREKSGGYGLHKAQFRNLPSDELIKSTFYQIPNSSWRLAYGLMATYGLRNHEIFFSDFSDLGNFGDQVLRVLPNTKTGEHQVWPFHPEWLDIFDLRRMAAEKNLLPKVTTDLNKTTLQSVGRRVAEQFKRYKLPMTPYDLRHAWAVRTIHIGLPDTVAARMMGHSVAIHTRTYHHWITRRDQQKAVDKALNRL